MAKKKPRKPPESVLTKEEIEACLRKGAENAKELDKQLRQIFRLPDRLIRLD